MFLHYSKIVTLNIAELRSQSKIGCVLDVVINNDNLSLSGLILKKQNIWQNKIFVIPINDIIEIENKGIIVSNVDSIVPIGEVVRIKKQFDEGYVGIDQKVITKSGKYIGKVYDYIVDSKSLIITKLYTKHLLNERIIPAKNVVSYDKKLIIINDDINYVDVSVATETSVV